MRASVEASRRALAALSDLGMCGDASTETSEDVPSGSSVARRLDSMGDVLGEMLLAALFAADPGRGVCTGAIDGKGGIGSSPS